MQFQYLCPNINESHGISKTEDQRGGKLLKIIEINKKVYIRNNYLAQKLSSIFS